MTAEQEESLDDLVIDTVVANRYRVDKRLAKGGMATVFRATDLTLNREVALKLLKPTKNTDDPGKLTARFKLEAEALAKLNHRHIVTIFDYGETEDGGYFLAMEYVDGPPLSALVRQDRLAPDRAIHLVIQVCKALRYAHSRGIVHRDLKPGNILVAREEDEEIAKLVDFGLVKLTEEDALTQHGLILGTVHCMAPEQIRGGKIDARTDLYAMGVVLFRLVMGQYPFNSKQTAEILAAHLHAQVPSFASIDANLLVPPGLEACVRKAMEKNPASRYESAAEMIQDLASCLSVPPEQFVSVSLVMKDVPALDTGSTRRNIFVGALLGTAALVALGIVTALAVALPSWRQPVDDHQAQVEERAAAEVAPSEAPAPKEPPDAAASIAAVAPAPQVAPPAPEPKEVAPAPKAVAPAPAPRVVAPAPAPRVVAPAPAPKVEPAPAPESAPVQPDPLADAAVVLKDVAVAKEADKVTVTLRMSGGDVRPLHYVVEGTKGAFQKQYRVQFKGGANAKGASTVAVGHELVDSVSIAEERGFLVVTVNSRTTPKSMMLQTAGSEHRIVVER